MDKASVFLQASGEISEDGERDVVEGREETENEDDVQEKGEETKGKRPPRASLITSSH